MPPMFVSPNNWPIFNDWLMIAQDGFRFVALRNGQGYAVRSTRHVRVVEIKDPADKATKEVMSKEIDHVCTEPAISSGDVVADAECRRVLGIAVPALQSAHLWLLGKNTRLFAVLGKIEGEATVKAYDKRKEKARLSVTVAKTISVPGVFHTVRHLPRGQKSFTPHSLKSNESSTRAALSLANQMLMQAAIRVDIHAYGHADVAMDLGTTVDVRNADGPEVLAIRAKRNKSVVPNVFTVGRIINNSGTSGATIEKRDIILDDHEDDYEFAQTLAHEFGHVFGLSHVYPDIKKQKLVSSKGGIKRYKVPATKNLMSGEDAEGLDRDQIRRMRTKALDLKN